MNPIDLLFLITTFLVDFDLLTPTSLSLAVQPTSPLQFQFCLSQFQPPGILTYHPFPMDLLESSCVFRYDDRSLMSKEKHTVRTSASAGTLGVTFSPHIPSPLDVCHQHPYIPEASAFCSLLNMKSGLQFLSASHCLQHSGKF